jgi:3-isopropylmalate dehydrogenase
VTDGSLAPAGGRPGGSGRPAYSIVAILGDGVGPEVVGHARTVLDAAGAAFGFDVGWGEVLAGGIAIDTHGTAIRAEDVERCAAADAVLLGAVGGPRWDDPNAKVRPEQALFALRGGLGLFANLRPVTVHPALVPSSPLRPELLDGVDLLIVRELTGGIYFGRPSEERETADGRIAVDTLWYAESEIRRIARLAFELARTRRSKVTQVDKANVLASSRLWRKVTEEVHDDYPDVQLENRLVDSTAMLLVTRPSTFDVVVTENLFGDILSDEAAVLAGSLGMLPSASLGERRTDHGTFGLYEPIHGSAPDIAGTDRANPIGTILSTAMLCRWSLGRPDVAAAIETAVATALSDGYRTADLASSGGPSASAPATRVVGGAEMAQVVVRTVAASGAAATSADRRSATAADPQAVGA